MRIYKPGHQNFRFLGGGGVWLAAVLLLSSGCETIPPGGDSAEQLQVRLSALTEFVATSSPKQPAEIKAYVELLDGSDSQLQMSGIFRFELYAWQPMASNPRGKRLVVWPDFDLTGGGARQQRWKSYLRAYEFHLPLAFTPSPERRYVLEVTCLTGEKRLSALKKLQFRP